MFRAAVIGTSYGGLDALKAIIPHLSKDFPLAVFVVLHIGDNKNDSFIRYLKKQSKVKIKEAEEKEEIKPGTVYFAPPNYHILIENDSTIALSADPKIHHSRPSIDVLFESAAWHFKNQLIGILLTGLNKDGALGIKEIQKYAGITIVEDPETATATIMPASAIEIMKPDYILPLDQISKKIIELSELY
ncbi:chemotaxis protein CheB [Labilibaculum euxinus]|uniref:protein-glutamate methylesterase n=1 Tax=Labilibaculum euxinus TaxID=2686357 RepID=A0A7M4D492_9BACT|nr:chemotaxis protein CheB [Labilibaculum euxinus]MUP37471.1 chemotaxis protein CheB [Labilibaculum euxinus]MVB06676.1 chemotaxis protein CheB [Labilibaculum euxinus]